MVNDNCFLEPAWKQVESDDAVEGEEKKSEHFSSSSQRPRVIAQFDNLLRIRSNGHF